jgi:hypothetical protein
VRLQVVRGFPLGHRDIIIIIIITSSSSSSSLSPSSSYHIGKPAINDDDAADSVIQGHGDMVVSDM